MKLFVYGTLMSNYGNNHRLENATLIQKDSVNGFCLYNVGYFPAAIQEPGTIYGEIYEINNIQLESCDQLESYPHHYNRTLIKTTHNHVAWIYFYPKHQPNLQKIPSGNFNNINAPSLTEVSRFLRMCRSWCTSAFLLIGRQKLLRRSCLKFMRVTE